jgi:hypothetical protein
MADIAQPRWYRLTPDRLVLLLLVIEVLLRLSDTKVSNAGVKRLQKALPNARIE